MSNPNTTINLKQFPHIIKYLLLFFADAIRDYERSDAIYGRVLRAGHPDRVEGVYGLGLAALAKGDEPLARGAAIRCAELEFDLFEAILTFTDERQRLAYQNVFRSQHLAAALGDAELVATHLLRQKGVVIDSLIREANLSAESDDPKIRDAQNGLASARARYREAFLAGESSDSDALKTLDEAVRSARLSLREILGTSAAETGSTQFGIAEAQAALREGEALVDYLRFETYRGAADFETRYGAVVVTKDSVTFTDCCAADSVDPLIAEMIPFFGSAQPDDDLARSLMTRLHDLLVTPLAAGINNSKSLVICPDGALHFVPFACLVTPDSRFLIENHDVRFVSSGRDLAAPRSGAAVEKSAFLVGNPAFADVVGNTGTITESRGFLAAIGTAILSRLVAGLGPLEGAEREVAEMRSIVENLGFPARVVIGSDATEPLLTNELDAPEILHFATHGIYLPSALPEPSAGTTSAPFVPEEIAGFQNPMFGSWLALAGAQETVAAWSRSTVPDPTADGILMANEAAELNLAGTRIVTLSACDTASGEATAGDGVLGLRRGFRLAGAESVLTTLWPINDAVTVEIMKDFYGRFGNENPAAALSSTQRDWLVRLRDQPAAGGAPTGIYWSIFLAGPFLLGK
ncbi:MAG: CHAT domain-containing protein [Planctomycetota bacterium]